MGRRTPLAVSFLSLLLLLWLVPGHSASVFITPPYLQLGHAFADGSLDVVWHAPAGSEEWRAEWRQADSNVWSRAPRPTSQDGVDREIWSVSLPVGRSGRPFDYRVLAREAEVARGRARAPSAPGQPIRFAVLGDVGDGSDNQRSLARRMEQIHGATPLDFGLLAGDVAYECGRREEYDRKFFPIFGPDAPNALMRQVPFAAAVGNHDVGDLRWPPRPFRCRSDYSFFTFWHHPAGATFPMQVGPHHTPKAPSNPAPLGGNLPTVLSRANYAFAWGDVHVTVLDSNRYVNWAGREMQDWLNGTLAAGERYLWRIVLMHHPPFSQSGEHVGDQWPRYLVPLFERHNVTLVFSGHVHNFQWFGPAQFTPDTLSLAVYQSPSGERGRMPGAIRPQADFDGVTRTVARWPVYVVSGAVGGSLDRGSDRCPANLRPARDCGEQPPADGSTPSVTIVDVGASGLVIRQISAEGGVLLERRLTRSATSR